MTDYPKWPDWALDPEPLNENYKMGLPDLVRRTDLEQGLARQRRIFSSGPTGFFVTWPMTQAQYRLFLGWKANALPVGGEGWFTIKVFDGDGYTERVVRFVKGPIEPTRSGGEWMTAAQIETFENVYPDMIETAAMMLTWDANLQEPHPFSDLSQLELVVDLFHGAVAELAADYASLVAGA